MIPVGRLQLLALKRRLVYPILAAIVAIGVGIGIPTLTHAAPRLGDLIFQGIQIIQVSRISDRQEVALGQQINQELVRKEVRLYRDPDLSRYIEQIGQRLAAKSSRKDIPYTFQVVRDKNVNAFATMGGFVYVNTGLIQEADNEAQLASVIAHEIGHIESRHAVDQMRRAAIAQGLAVAAGVDSSRLVGIGVELAVNRPSSRQNELEADKLGLNSLTSAGYAPSAMPDFMKKLQSSRSVPALFSTHPDPAYRVTVLQKSINPATANQGDGLDTQAYRSQVRRLART
jgi:beta-barrel assembly-enhancing protease